MIRIVIEITGDQQVQIVQTASASAPAVAASVPPAAAAAPIEAAPAPAAAAVPAAPASPEEDRVAWGKQVFFDLLTIWLSGYDDADAPQPDRALRMGRVFQVRKDALGLKAYLEHHRGLEAAIIDCYPSMDALRAAQIAANMAQVASAMQFPLIPRIYYEGVGIKSNPEPGDSR